MMLKTPLAVFVGLILLPLTSHGFCLQQSQPQDALSVTTRNSAIALYTKKDTSTTTGFDRRNMLQRLVGGVVSMAAGDMLLNTVGATVYRRVLLFGQQYPETAIASEELMAWVAASSQKAAAAPEITAWLAAQKQLQTTVYRNVAATTAVGGMVEEGIMAAATGTALKTVMSSPASSSSAGKGTTPGERSIDSESLDDETGVLSSTTATTSTQNKRNDDVSKVGKEESAAAASTKGGEQGL